MYEVLISTANKISEMFGYDFFSRALLVGALVSLCASLLGTGLVLKSYSMIGDGLSHIGFGALSVAAAFGWAPLWFSAPVVVIAAVLLLRVSGGGKVKGDALIAVVSSGSLAVGFIVLSLAEVNVDISSYMFGSILALQSSDVILSAVSSVIVIFLYIIFYNKIFSVTFDESFSSAVGIKTKSYNLLLAILTAITIVVGMRLMGALLISSLIIFPPLTAMRVCRSFKAVTICSACSAVICLFAGLVLTFMFPLPAGACVVSVNLAVFIIFSAVGRLRGN